MKLRTFTRWLTAVLVPVLLCATIAGCSLLSAAIPILADVVAYVADGQQIIDAIERFTNVFFTNHPDVDAQKKVTEALIKTRASLNAALRLAQGAKNLNDQQVDEAFAEFKQAYLELLALTKAYGVTQAEPGVMKMKASPNALTVPEPMAFKARKH